MSDVITFNPSRALTQNITAAAGARAFFYNAGTTTLKTVYADGQLTIPHPSPLVANAAGIFPQVFSDGAACKVVVQTSTGATLYTLDPAPSDRATAFTPAGINFPDVAALLADVTMTYAAGNNQVIAGDVVQANAEGFAYRVASSGASDHNVTTAGGVKLYAVVAPTQYYASRAALQAARTESVRSAVVAETGQENVWIWRSGDFSARITSGDPQYIASSANPTGNLGAWELGPRARQSRPHFIVSAGQSNMALCELTSIGGGLATWTPPPNLRVWNNANFADASGDTSSSTVGDAWIAPPTNRITLGLACAAAYARENPDRDVFVLVAGHSGMSITNWSANTPNAWGTLLNQRIAACLAAVPGMQVDELLWYQGENDVASPLTYALAFQTFINNLTHGGVGGRPHISIFGIINSSLRATTQSTAFTTQHDDFNDVQRRIAAIGAYANSGASGPRTYIGTDWVPASQWDAFLHCRAAYRILAERWLRLRSGYENAPLSGRWIPEVRSNLLNTGSAYSRRHGWWSRVGDTITLGFDIALTAAPSTAGAVTLFGFNTVPGFFGGADTKGGGATRYAGQLVLRNTAGGTTVSEPHCEIDADSNIRLYCRVSGAATNFLLNTNLTATTEFLGSITYRSPQIQLPG